MALPSLIVPFLSTPLAIRGRTLYQRTFVSRRANATVRPTTRNLPPAKASAAGSRPPIFTATLMLLRLLSGIALAASETAARALVLRAFSKENYGSAFPCSPGATRSSDTFNARFRRRRVQSRRLGRAVCNLCRVPAPRRHHRRSRIISLLALRRPQEIGAILVS